MKALPSHVALLVPSVRKAAEHLRSFGFHIGEEEEWEGEGTLEVYVERGLGNSLLLMQPLRAGAYRRALEKRGPGFHHFAIDILNLENYLSSLADRDGCFIRRAFERCDSLKPRILRGPVFPD
jgi:catechol 2,3-dioxygenase-like lactoylglutathione lyase family enzyme